MGVCCNRAGAQRWSHLCKKKKNFLCFSLTTDIYLHSFFAFLLAVPGSLLSLLSGFRLSWLVYWKLCSASQPCLWLFKFFFITLGLLRWSASKALGDKILTACAITLWRRTFVQEAPWWHTGNSSLIKRLANCCLNYCTERMKWVCKDDNWGNTIFFAWNIFINKS